MPAPIRIAQRALDDLNERLLAKARVNIEVTQYTNRPGGVLCQMFLRNGVVIEGYAVRSKANDGRMEARRRALKQVILIEQYLEVERLSQEAAKDFTKTIKPPHTP